MKHKKSRSEISTSFHVCCAEICRLFGCGYVAGHKIFLKAQAVDMEELGDNYFDHSQVRLSTVIKVLGITEKELLKKASANGRAYEEILQR